MRYYLNGLLLDVRDNVLRCVATDGHRLALAETRLETRISTRRQIIIPRKGVLELQGLFESAKGWSIWSSVATTSRLTRGG